MFILNERALISRHPGAQNTVRILGFGTYDRARHPRAGILLDGLQAGGQEVRELNAPLGFSTAERVAMLGKPWLAHRMATRLARRWWSLVGGRARLGRWSPDVVVVGYLGHFDVLLARILFPRKVIVLDLLIFAADTARDRGAAEGFKMRLLTTLDELAARCATVVVLDTEEHVALMSPRQREKVVVIPVGAPDAWFSSGDLVDPDPDAVSRPLRVVFFGLYTPLQGAPTIGAAIAELAPSLGTTDTANTSATAEPRIEFTMIGSGQDLAETRRLAGDTSTVQWLDWVEPADLPALVHTHDVCLGIFGDSPKALRVTPNKVYQGAAAGCAILTSDTPPQRRSLADCARYVPPADPTALAAELRWLAANRAELRVLQLAAHQLADEQFRGLEVTRPLVQVLLKAVTPPVG
jgi:glycosyltransferase involved in cell wall biosynthesis